MIDYAIILDRKYKGKGQWSITDNDYNQFIWQSDKPKPTKKELDALFGKTEMLYIKNKNGDFIPVWKAEDF